MSENVPTRQGWQIAEAVQEYRGAVADDLFVLYADYARIVAELEQAHAAALEHANAMTRYFANRADNWRDRAEAAAPRILTADDPEPAVGSVVLDKDGTAGQRVYTDDGVTTIWQFSDDDWCHEWGTVDRVRGPVTLIHGGGAA